MMIFGYYVWYRNPISVVSTGLRYRTHYWRDMRGRNLPNTETVTVPVPILSPSFVSPMLPALSILTQKGWGPTGRSAQVVRTVNGRLTQPPTTSETTAEPITWVSA